MHGEPARGVHGECSAGAPAEPIGGLGGHRLHLDPPLDAGETGQLLGEDVTLDPALLGEGDMAELGAAHRRLAPRCAFERVRKGPGVGNPVRGGLEDLDHVTAPETRIVVLLGQPDPDLLARQRVPDEDHTAVDPRNEVATVRRTFHGDITQRGGVEGQGSRGAWMRGCIAGFGSHGLT